jgi:hypothetical protein
LHSPIYLVFLYSKICFLFFHRQPSNFYLEILNNEFNKKSSSNHSNISNKNNNNNNTESDKLNQAIDASDILAPSELEDSDLLKNEDYNFDLASKSLLFNTLSENSSNITQQASKPAKSSKLTHSNSNLSTRSTSKLSQQYKHIPGKMPIESKLSTQIVYVCACSLFFSTVELFICIFSFLVLLLM